MKKSTLTKSLLIIALAVLPLTFFGQEEKQMPSNYWTLGIEGGATSLYGDNKQSGFDDMSWNAGIYGGYVMKNSLYLYANIGYVTLKGSSENSFTIDECDLFQANFNIGYDVLQLFKINPHRVLGIVPHWGLGVAQHRTKTTFADGTVIKNGYSDIGNGGGIDGRRNVFQNVFGVNFVFNFSKHFQANIDFASYKTDTDYLDNVGGPEHNKHNDWYATANIGIAYKFGRKEIKPCPVCPECPECPECEVVDVDKAVNDAIEQYKKDNPCPEPVPVVIEKAAVEYEAKDMYITFAMGKAEVENTPANKAELKKISDDIDNGREISEIKVIGHASPEGNAKFNEKLSKDRADATAKFIKEGLGEQARGIAFATEGEGADWDGFIEEVENSNIENKAEIVNELNNANDKVATLKKLVAKYPELTKLYPELRQTEVLIK